ncbi:MAG TPA: MgtC/SapB family protein [Gemmatimonadaceae bacterium]|nr:MgtC/SapB family protein [Gemmatimonadaceae bacterium]
MNEFLREITNGLPDATEFARAVVRLLVAALLGAVVGFERERAGKAAGLRTHMLVALGAALLMLAAAESGMTSSDLSRIIQGVITGIGFLGAGSILKSEEQREIRGLTTAAGIWLTAGVGVAAGLGRWGTAAVAVTASWIILGLLTRLERRLDVNDPVKKNEA